MLKYLREEMLKMSDELYLKRKVDDFLLAWKNDPNRKPLIIKGCRQIGKTKSIEHFAEVAHYESFIEINFAREPKYKSIITDGYDVESIKKNISLLDTKKRFVPGKTLILFDEITKFPEIATSLKFFKEDGRFDVICSGSMLGINYKRIESVSVGNKTDYQMFSMDFEEFLWAKGYGQDVIDDMLKHMQLLKPFNDVEMSVFHSLFLDFSILGGMPDVVKQYIINNSFEGSLENQRQLVLDHKEDVKTYAEGVDKTRILSVLNGIPSQLAKENKKFQLSKLDHGARFKDYRGCAEWLTDAGIVNMCFCLNSPSLPLGGNYDPDKYKLYFADTGLLVSLLDDEAQDDLRENKNLGVYKGALYENFVAEALVKEGYKLYYYRNTEGTIEEDFFIRTANSLIPIEVKSKTGRAVSLKTLIESKKYDEIKFGIKLSAGNIGYKDGIYSFPYFCTFLLKKAIKELIKDC